MKLIIRALKRELRRNVLFLFALEALLISFVVWNWDSKGLFFYAISLVGLLVLFFLIKIGLILKQINDTNLVSNLLRNKENIVWVYSILTQRMPFGLQMNRHAVLYFKLIDGDEITLEVPEKELKAISLFLNQHLPHATFGYTPERAQWYIANPVLLLRDEF